MRNVLSNSNSNARRAFIARSTNRGRVFDGARGCPRLRRNKAGHRLSWNLEHSIVACLCIRTFFVSGYRGLSCFAEHSPGRFANRYEVFISQADRVAARVARNNPKSFVWFRKSCLHGVNNSHGERQGVVRA